MKAGDYVGHYLLENHLGKGGFGDVWLANDETAIFDEYKRVAVKIPDANKLDDGLLNSLTREAKVWKKATGHPNVLAFIDARRFGDQFVLVSEYADGGSLQDLLEGKSLPAESLKKEGELITIWQGTDKHGKHIEQCKLSPSKTLEIMIGILRGLDFLHSQRIIHKDLKLANILLKENVPCIADFGISRVFENTVQMANKTLQIAGTPSYMAPECFNYVRNERTDIWATGVIFYKLLTGEFPFNANGGLEELISNIVNANPKPLPSEIPQNLQEVITGVLHKKPDDRLTIKKIFEKLGKDDEETLYRVTDEEYSTIVRKNSLEEYFNKGLACHEKKEYEEAVKWFDQAIYKDVNFADAYDARGVSFCELKKFEESVKDFDLAIYLNPNNAQFYKNRGVAYREWKNFEKAFNDLNRAIEIDSKDAQFYYERAGGFAELDEYLSAVNDLTKAIILNRTNNQYYHGRAYCYYRLGETDLALEDINKAIRINSGRAVSFHLRGLINWEKIDNAGALKDFSQAIRLNTDEAIYYSCRGQTYFVLEKYDLAINDFRKALEIKPDYEKAKEELSITLKFQKYWWWYKLIEKIKKWW